MTEDELYQKIPSWIAAEKKDWTIATFLAYFCKKYEDKNGIRFRITKSKNGPLSSKEMRDFSNLFKKFLPEDFEDLRKDQKITAKEKANIKLYNYINWMFDYKFRMPGSSPDGTQIFFSPTYINNFERMYAEAVKKTSKKSSFEMFIQKISVSFPQFLEDNECSTESDLKMINTIWIQKGSSDNDIKKVLEIAKGMELL
jgi:hypothetical protein